MTQTMAAVKARTQVSTAESELIRDFVNTIELDTGVDELTTRASLSAWCAAHGLAPKSARASAEDLSEALALREAIRALLLANNGVEVDVAAASEVLDRIARHARIELRFGLACSELEPQAAGVGGALGRLLLAVYGSMADGSWSRLKACRARDCEWAFIDTAKNHSREWCSMSVCGNREKARAHRARRRAEHVHA
jgi:predicted RNA-binding Zn ribbon-like protein